MENTGGSQRPVPWGVALRHLVDQQPGGLKRLTEAIAEEVGPELGSRNSFRELFMASSTEMLNGTQQRRAWYLVSACGADPGEWGLDDEVLPPLHFRTRKETGRAIRRRVTIRKADGSLAAAA